MLVIVWGLLVWLPRPQGEPARERVQLTSLLGVYWMTMSLVMGGNVYFQEQSNVCSQFVTSEYEDVWGILAFFGVFQT